jgi:hypothetical protein
MNWAILAECWQSWGRTQRSCVFAEAITMKRLKALLSKLWAWVLSSVRRSDS